MSRLAPPNTSRNSHSANSTFCKSVPSAKSADHPAAYQVLLERDERERAFARTKPHLKKSPPPARLARACDWPLPQLVSLHRGRASPAHNDHVSSESRNQASNSLMVRSMDSLSTARTCTPKVKPEKRRKLGTHFARHVVDTKGKVLFARTFIHNIKFASAGKSHPNFPRQARRI